MVMTCGPYPLPPATAFGGPGANRAWASPLTRAVILALATRRFEPVGLISKARLAG